MLSSLSRTSVIKGHLDYGGEGGIRTHEPGFARLPAFEAGSFNRSDTSPERKFSGGSVSEQSEAAAIFAPQKTSAWLARILRPARRRALRLDDSARDG